jgi:DNA primase
MGVIDDIKERLDIVEVISESVQLRKTGRSFLGFCPFHSNTRTPAFTVYPDTQSFYCFGCHAAGTVFDFVMRKQGLDFSEALQQLATRAGVQLKPRSEEEQQQDQQRTRLLDLTSLAARYFNYILLQHPRGQPGRDYLAQRDIHPETMETFQLGYSMNEWGHLLAYLTDKKGYSPEEVAAAGLAIHHEQRGYYDRFRGRLMFPIRNAKAEVVGFGGRALGDAQPKYMNTPQTLLFDKSHVLYGLDLARDHIRSADATVVVEGYVDVITAHQHGFRNVVAPLGTALTAGHVGLIKKLSHNVYMALDADAAGQRATLRGLDAFHEAQDDQEGQPVVTAQGLVRWERDVTLRIIKLPPGRDPDDVIKSDPQQWQALIDNALPVVDFYIEAYTAGLNLSQPQDQQTALERLVPLIKQLDSTQQRVYIARLEQVVGIRAELILDLLRGSPGKPKGGKRSPPRPQERPRPEESQPAQQSPGDKQGALHRREDYLLALLLRHPSAVVAVEAVLVLDLDQFPQAKALLGEAIDQLLNRTENRIIWQSWQQAGLPGLLLPLAEADGSMPELPDWAQHLDESLHAQVMQLVTFQLPHHQGYRYVQDAENCARHLRLEQTRRWQRRLMRQISDHEDAAEQERILLLLAELQTYMATISAPRRNSNWVDVRDTLGKPHE